MKIKIKTIHFIVILTFLVILFSTQCFAAEEIEENHLCSGAVFVKERDQLRCNAFNVAPAKEETYNPYTETINNFLTKGKVNTEKKASQQTIETVALAMIGTAIIYQGKNWNIREHFKTLSKEHPLYFHYAALYTIEALANHLATAVSDAAAELTKHFSNFAFLCNVSKDTFTGWFDVAKQSHQAGLDELVLKDVGDDEEEETKTNKTETSQTETIADNDWDQTYELDSLTTIQHTKERVVVVRYDDFWGIGKKSWIDTFANHKIELDGFTFSSDSSKSEFEDILYKYKEYHNNSECVGCVVS